MRDFHAAFIANNALIARVFDLAAVTLPITSRAKNGLTKSSVFFWPQPAVMDRFRLQNLTISPHLYAWKFLL